MPWFSRKKTSNTGADKLSKKQKGNTIPDWTDTESTPSVIGGIGGSGGGAGRASRSNGPTMSMNFFLDHYFGKRISDYVFFVGRGRLRLPLGVGRGVILRYEIISIIMYGQSLRW
jgi:hypothetical protein